MGPSLRALDDRVSYEDHEYFIYIVCSRSGTLYIGMTNSIYRRALEHKRRGIEGFASKYGCDRLVYYENFDDVHKVIGREKQLKGWSRAKKIASIEFEAKPMNEANPMNNVEFRYMYRDGGNYKKRGSVIFSNPDQLDSNRLDIDLRQSFLEDGLFVAQQIRVPEVFLYADGPFSSDDHCYHEFISISPTTSETDDTYIRSISEFILEVAHEARHGWQMFDPYDSEGSYNFLLTSRIR